MFHLLAVLIIGLVGATAVGAAIRAKWFAPETVLVGSLIIPWQFLPGVHSSVFLNPFPFVAIAYGVGAAILRPRGARRLRSLGLGLLLPIGPAISAVHNGVVERSLLYWIPSYVSMSAAVWLYPPVVKALSKAMIWAGALVSVEAIAEVAGFNLFRHLLASNPTTASYLVDTTFRAIGPLGNPLFTAAFLVVAICFVGLAELRRSFIKMVLLLLLSFGIVVTGSKSGVIALLAAVAYLVFRGGQKRVRQILGVGAVLFALGLGHVAGIENLTSRLAQLTHLSTSDPDRVFTARFVGNEIKTHFVGGQAIGQVEDEKMALSPAPGGSQYGIESTWLGIGADGGGLILTIYFVGLACSCRRRNAALIAGLIALTTDLLFWNAIGAWPTMNLYALMAGAILFGERAGGRGGKRFMGVRRHGNAIGPHRGSSTLDVRALYGADTPRADS
jgi:hypothetical protein